MTAHDVGPLIHRIADPAAGGPADSGLVDLFRAGMGRLAGAVTIITAGHGATARGLTATAVCSVSIGPPTLLVCVNTAGEAHRAILDAGAFCVNVLAEENRAIADRFAGRVGAFADDKFAAGSWSRLATGAPALDGALVNIDCRIAEGVSAYTHTVFFGTVAAVRLGADGPPLVHYERAYRSLA